MQKTRLAIVSTHPIQYYAPVFRELAGCADLEPRVFFTWSQTESGRQFDAGFGKEVTWDIPLREGYAHEFVPNVAKRPSTNHFRGIVNPTLTQAIDTWRADAVLVYGWNLCSHFQALRHFKGKLPVFFRGDSTLLDPRPPLRSLARKAFLRWVYRHIDVAIAVGQNNRDYFAWCGVPTERIAFAPHSVDVRRFADADDTHTAHAVAWRKALEIEADATVVVFAGKLIAKKDPRLLLEAFLQVAQRADKRAHLVIVGNGAMETELRTVARGHRNVSFLPFQNQATMPAVYRLGDVFVLPSRGPGETWGLALNEAMASSRAIIASSRVGGARDLIRPGANGWVFEAGHAASLCEVLGAALALDRVEVARMGAHGRQMSEGWSAEASARAIAAAVRLRTGTGITPKALSRPAIEGFR